MAGLDFCTLSINELNHSLKVYLEHVEKQTSEFELLRSDLVALLCSSFSLECKGSVVESLSKLVDVPGVKFYVIRHLNRYLVAYRQEI